MKKLTLLAAMVYAALVAAAPAIAQVSQEFSQEDVESGDVEPTVEISNSGDNANICGTVLQSANSGNVQNQQGVVQYGDAAPPPPLAPGGAPQPPPPPPPVTLMIKVPIVPLAQISGADDIEFEGSNITIESEAEGECVQTIEQAAAAAR